MCQRQGRNIPQPEKKLVLHEEKKKLKIQVRMLFLQQESKTKKKGQGGETKAQSVYPGIINKNLNYLIN